MVISSTVHGRRSNLDHRALIVDADDTIPRLLLPRLRRKITLQQAVLMVVGTDTEAIIRDRLGPDAHALQWAPANTARQRTGFTFAKFLRYLRERQSRQEVVDIVAEPDVAAEPQSPVNRASAYVKYEAMANEVYTCYRCSITCIWHSRRHSPSIIDEVRKVHQSELGPGGVVDNPGYVAPGDYLRERSQAALAAVPPVTDIDITVWHPEEVAACRAAIARWAALRHFIPAAVRQVVAATSEVVANGLRHGRPPVRARAWRQDAMLIVDVEDHGGRSIPADAGYRPPVSPADSAGLWVARQLADVLVTHAGNGLTTVRMYFPYAVTHRNLTVPT
jgi:anti-sigma regulatory factor (Ser/Thr protein kinase)